MPVSWIRRRNICTGLLAIAMAAPGVAQTVSDNVVEPILEQGQARLQDNVEAQKTVSSVHEQTLSLINDYDEKLKIIDGLNAYNQMLDKQVNRQLQEMDALRESIQNVAVIERQILPLLARMLDGLQEFIGLDAPFLLEERYKRIDTLRDVIARVDVTVAEKTRRVFEAYQIENDYGRTIEAYREKVALDNGVFDADILRIGRTSIVYRTLGSGDMGFWDKNNKQWQPLSGSVYRSHFEKGIKVANQEMAPELLTIPVVYGGSN